MTTWRVTIAPCNNVDAIQDIELDADTLEEAEREAEAKCPALHYIEAIKKKRGGARPGAGRKKGTQGTYGCETKVVRVPVDIAPELPELIINIEQLREMLSDWEAEANNSTSPRYDRARKLIHEIRALGF